MFRRALPFFALALLVWAWAPAVGSQESIESQLLGLINGGRRGSQLTAHAGLKVVGRQHSQEMSSAGGLNHNGAQSRIDTAPPDPAEPNGPPDDGFTGTWCENVAYVRGAPENEVAQRIHQGWVDSPSHNRCMNDARMTVAGIGIYFDGNETYWATFESAVDQTLPGSAPVTPTPSPTPEPDSTPAQTEPEPTDRPTPTPREEPTERPTPTARPIFGGTSPSPDIAEIVGGALDAVPRPVARGVAATDTFVAAPAIPVGSENPSFSRIGLASTIAVLFLAADLMRRLSKRRRETP